MLHQQPDYRLHIGDGLLFAQQLLIQRLALRLQHFRRLETQRQVVVQCAQERVHLPRQDGVALFGESFQGSAGKLGFERLPEALKAGLRRIRKDLRRSGEVPGKRSEEHTSELQSLRHLVCRLLLEKKEDKKKIQTEYGGDIVCSGRVLVDGGA